jgi:hypothetical protein
MREAFFNMSFGGGSRQDAAAIYRDDVRILLDESAFSEGGYPLVDVKDATKVEVVSGGRSTVVTEVLNRKSPPPILLSKVQGCCVYGIPPHLAPRYQQELEKRPFEQENVRFLSLIRDSGTETAIDRTSNLKSVRLGEPGQHIEDLSQIEAAFQSARGKTVMMVSHVEGERFVTRDPAGNVTVDIPIASVRSLAAEYNVTLVDLGCQTAQQISTDSLGFGVMTKFNTVAAVESLERALSRSSNYSEFFNNLTSENLKVVVDAGFVLGWPMCADVYAKARTTTPLWVKLARIFVSFGKS